METADSPALLILDLPPAALAGIDLLSFTATPKFRGIKNLPPGWHFAFVGSSTAFSERHGIWFKVPSQAATTSSDHPLVVTKWDASSETLTLVTDETELLRHRANLGTVWRDGLAPYRQQASKPGSSSNNSAISAAEEEVSDWPSLTSNITSLLLSRITSNTDFHLTSASSSKADLETIPGLTSADLNHEDGELHFLPIDLKQTWREGATGRERTDAAQDRSWALENLITHHCKSGRSEELIGELQFTFLMVLTLNNFSSLEQWKRILSLLFTSKAAVPTRPDLFINGISTLRLQLQHCQAAEGGLIDLADEGGSLLRMLLIRFRRGLETLAPGEEVQDVLDELSDLESYLQAEHGWSSFSGSFAKSGTLELEDGEQVQMETTAYDEDDETGEFAPLVVELTGEERRALGLGDEVVLHESLGRASLGEERAGGKVQGRAVEEASSASEDGDSGDSSDEEMDDLEDMDARY